MSALTRLAIGDWIDYDDEGHQVIGFVGTATRLRSASGGVQIVATGELLAHAARATPVVAEAPKIDVGAVLDGLDAKTRRKALDLHGHLQEVLTGYKSGDPAEAAPGEPRPDYAPDLPKLARIDAKAAELGKSRRRVFQWLRALDDHGLWGLVDKSATRPHNPLARADERVIEAIREQWQIEKSESAAGIGTRFRRRVQQRLDATWGAGTVTVPPVSTWYRLVDHLLHRSPASPTKVRQTEDNQPDGMFGHVSAVRPGEIVMMDTSPLDAIAYDPATDTTGPVELTLAIDLATRSLLAWRLTPVGTKGIDVGMVLADVMTPEPMRPHWPASLRYAMTHLPFDRILDLDQRLAAAAARPVIYPEAIVIDHGKPYQAELMTRGCRRLGISIHDARVQRATDKAAVERVFGTIRAQFAEHVAGYKGYDVAHRGRRVEDAARWSITELAEFFAEYVVAAYQRQRHKGLIIPGYPEMDLSPNDAYALAITYTGFVACPTDPNIYFELLPIEWRTIQPYGVEIDHLIYDDELAFGGLRRGKSTYQGAHPGKWPIRHDPRNRLHAYFCHPRTGAWHTLRWTHASADIRPFTDVTLREAKRLLSTRGLKVIEQDDIAAALHELQNRTDAPETWLRTQRKHVARDAERARAAARDRDRGAAPIDDDTPPRRGLRAVPSVDDDGPDLVLDLTDLDPFDVVTPHSHEQDRR